MLKFYDFKDGGHESYIVYNNHKCRFYLIKLIL